MKFRHYGSSEFEDDRFQLISHWDNFMCKPRVGGLWASPVNSEFGWADFCRSERFNLESLDTWFDFSISEDAKLLIVNGGTDLEGIPIINESFYINYLDYDYIQQQYDGIYLSMRGYLGTLSSGFDGSAHLMGWDCECLLIINKNILQL